MKKLYILPHPQKDEQSLEDDFFIPLTQQGIEDAKSLAQKLKEKKIELDLIVSSPSLRTETTSMIISETLNMKKKVLYHEVLYQGFMDELTEEISFTFYSVESLLIVGHIPLLSNLANHFIGYKEKLKPGIILEIEFQTNNWVDVSAQNAKFVQWITP